MRSGGFVSGRAVAAIALLIAAGVGMPRALPAQSGFPGGKPITLIVPYAAGGTTDSGARLLAARLDEELPTRVQVVNRAGAASQVGLQALLASPPNGYTLSYAVLPTVITHYSDPEREPPYARKDFRPVAHPPPDPRHDRRVDEQPVQDAEGVRRGGAGEPGEDHHQRQRARWATRTSPC